MASRYVDLKKSIRISDELSINYGLTSRDYLRLYNRQFHGINLTRATSRSLAELLKKFKRGELDMELIQTKDGLRLDETEIRLHPLKLDALLLHDYNFGRFTITRDKADLLAVILLHFYNTGELLSDVDSATNLT